MPELQMQTRRSNQRRQRRGAGRESAGADGASLAACDGPCMATAANASSSNSSSSRGLPWGVHAGAALAGLLAAMLLAKLRRWAQQQRQGNDHGDDDDENGIDQECSDGGQGFSADGVEGCKEGLEQQQGQQQQQGQGQVGQGAGAEAAAPLDRPGGEQLLDADLQLLPAALPAAPQMPLCRLVQVPLPEPIGHDDDADGDEGSDDEGRDGNAYSSNRPGERFAKTGSGAAVAGQQQQAAAMPPTLPTYVLPTGAQQCDAALHQLLPLLRATSVLGLDCEWAPEARASQHNKVAVLQLSAARHCLLLQPLHTACGVPAALRQLLADPGVIKCGVGIEQDVRRLAQDYGVQVQGWLDVRFVARRHCPDALFNGPGLAAMSAALLGLHIDKGLQQSAWDTRQLSEAQVQYAAQDAWLSRQLLVAMFRRAQGQQQEQEDEGEEERREKEEDKGQQQHVEDNGQQQLDLQQAAPTPSASAFRAFAAPFIAFTGGAGANFSDLIKRPSQANALGSGSGSGRGNGSSGSGSGAGMPKKPGRYATRKTQLYENCKLMAPDGGLLCTCSSKKVNWYLERGLGTVVCEDPLTVRLKFEPRGRGHPDDRYYVADKQNRCVVCGMEQQSPGQQQQQQQEEGPGQQQGAQEAAAGVAAAAGSADAADTAVGGAAGSAAVTAGGSSGSSSLPYLRHSVVPHCYRQHFPVHMKSHLSHDVCLMCLPCHQLCSTYDQQRMAELGRQYDAPLQQDNQRYKYDQAVAGVLSAAKALSNTKVSLPAARRAELEACVLQYYGAQEVTPELLQQAVEVNPRKPADEWASHAELVVKAVSGSDPTNPSAGVEEFVRSWRRHFLATMKPRFLPPHWSVDSRVSNSSAPGLLVMPAVATGSDGSS